MSGHMTPEEFREHGRRVVDRIADYMEEIESHPVRSRARPGDVRAALPAHPPEDGEPFDAVLRDLDEVILPGLTHWQHPSFFGYFPANTSGPAILGDLLSSGLGVQGMSWETSPACTELESLVVDWLAELLGLAEHFRTDTPGGGAIQDSASSSTLAAVLAALHRAGGGKVVRQGTHGAFTVYASSQTHSSLEKAARMAGIGSDQVRVVDVDPRTSAMDPHDLRSRIAADQADGAIPALVCATVGTTSTTAVDPVRDIGAVCREHGAWLHVDAAYAGTAAVCPELRWINDGVAEYADSYVTDPHKWLLTTFDCSVLWVADRAPLVEALSILPEYLRNAASASGEVIDYRDWQVPLGRRFRALKLWSVIRWYGAAGLREHIRGGVRLAGELAELAGGHPGFTVLEPHPLGLVCLRPEFGDVPEDDAEEATRRMLHRLNESGELYLTHTKVGGRTVLRIAVGAPSTERRHVLRAWDLLCAEYERTSRELSDEVRPAEHG